MFLDKKKKYYYSQASSGLSIVKSRTTPSVGGMIGFIASCCIACDDA